MTKALVTGATGFLGRHVCLRLQAMGWEVAGMGRNRWAGSELEALGIRFIHADLRDREQAELACWGQDAVFHCGALSSPWGPYRDFQAVNVDGTAHITAGCLKHGVGRLVHISTPSIYFNGHEERLGVKEDAALPSKPVNAYAATKLKAEQVVRQAFREGLAGLILRPRAIFGPGDTALLPRLMRANDTSGIPLFRNGQVLLDLTYVDNVVDAMLLGWQAPEEALGQAYNITNGEPALLKDVLMELFTMLGMPLRTKKLPYPVAYGAAALLEWSHTLLPVLGEPTFTRYSVSVLAQSQTLDISRAHKLLGYTPQVSLHEGLRRFAEWWIETEGSRNEHR
ncbi:NAD-dependent epimerase/dehydratase family protein [Paenibacillus mesotrionivorans]|uniref:NAD-dependent epimerase/dehydratase family protein n=1 Tax=Paenibacillus mesotrionivorans TaxID=3160968 RepID=A0ACC7P0M3_9BACL